MATKTTKTYKAILPIADFLDKDGTQLTNAVWTKLVNKEAVPQADLKGTFDYLLDNKIIEEVVS